MKIHIFGASGSGVSTLGKNLALRLNISLFDADDYFWKKTDPPFTESNPPEMRLQLLKTDLAKSTAWIVSGSLISWGDELKHDFTSAIYLYVSSEERLRRIKAREADRFGSRIQDGGDMFEAHQKFLEWAMQYDDGPAGGRSKPRHEAWIKTLECNVVTIDGSLNEKEVLEKALNLLQRNVL